MPNEFKDGKVIKSYNVGIFIKDLENYFQQKKTTELEVAIDTEVEEKHFIADVNPTTFSKSTKISLPNDLYTIKGEKDFEFFFKRYLELVKGTPEPIEVVIVYKAFGSKLEGYTAWQFPKTQIMFKSYNAKESVLNYDFDFGNGVLGKATVSEGSFKFTPELQQ